MKKCYCDLCGKEIAWGYSLTAYARGIKIIDRPEVCEECMNKFKRTIESFENAFISKQENNNGQKNL